MDLENAKQNLKEYERILIGFPIWFWTCPKAVTSFINENNLKGKTIYPFCTSGGIQITEAVDEIKRNVDGATVKKGKSFRNGLISKITILTDRCIIICASVFFLTNDSVKILT